jgi:flagellar basal-body rod modification protein FlgD
MTLTTSATLSSGTTAGSGSTSTGTLSASFDSFLKLLTAQLQHQDPLSPMDATQFTSQLVQFSTVEQAVQTNSQLGQLTRLTQASSLTSALSLMGMRVEYGGGQIALGQQGGASIAYTLPQGADKVTVTIRNASGAVVRQAQGPTAAGNQAFAWDGLGDNGLRLPAGSYSAEVAAVGADGSPAQVSRGGSGVVDGVETTSDGVRLSIGGATVPLADVDSVSRPAS